MKAFSLFFRRSHLYPLIPSYTVAAMMLKYQAGRVPHAYTFQGTDNESPLLPTLTKLLPAAPAASQTPALGLLHFCPTLPCFRPSAWLSDSPMVFLCWERSPFPSLCSFLSVPRISMSLPGLGKSVLHTVICSHDRPSTMGREAEVRLPFA